MKLTETERAILVGIHRDATRIAALPWAGDGHSRGPRLGHYRLGIEEAREGIVPLEPTRWLGHALDGAGRRAFSRTIERLASAGLVVRHGDQRTKRVSLTAKGQQVAELLVRE